MKKREQSTGRPRKVRPRKGRGSNYEEGAQMTLELVFAFKLFGTGKPLFAMMRKEIALIGSLKDVGQYLARNDSALELLKLLLAESDKRRIDYPTILMLQTALEWADIPCQEVESFSELGIPGNLPTHLVSQEKGRKRGNN